MGIVLLDDLYFIVSVVLVVGSKDVLYFCGSVIFYVKV